MKPTIHFAAGLLALLSLSLTLSVRAQESKQDLLKKKVLLPNGWSLTPAGASLQPGDRKSAAGSFA